MPIPESAAVLKSYFQTGDKPTEAQFADWIDTMFAMAQAAQDTADAAVAAAAAAQKLRVLCVMTTNVSMTIYKQIGIDSVTLRPFDGIQQTFRFTWTAAFPDVNYHVTCVFDQSQASVSTPVIIAKNFAYVDIHCPAPSGKPNIIQLTIFDDYA